MARNVKDWINGFMALTENSEPPVLFRKWTAISTIASALQRKTHIKLGLSITVYPNFYIVLVGPSATGKGTVMSYAADILKQIPSIRLSAQATSLQALIRRMKDTNLTDIDIVTGKQMFHSSMTIFSKEFTVFLGYHNRELMAALCDWFDCDERWSYDTIKRDKEEIVGVWVNLLGGTTPDSIQTSLPIEAIGGGLTSRIIFVNESKREKLVIFPTQTAAELELQQMLISDLERVSLLSGSFSFTADASSFYADWCINSDASPPFHDKKFDGYLGRRRRHLNALAMVCSASRSDDMIVTMYDFQRAAFLLSEVENRMAGVFKGIGRSEISSLINDAITYLVNSPSAEIPLWEFARKFEGDADKLTFDRVMQTLQEMKYIEILKRPGLGSFILRLDDVEDRSNSKQSTLEEV